MISSAATEKGRVKMINEEQLNAIKMRITSGIAQLRCEKEKCSLEIARQEARRLALGGEIDDLNELLHMLEKIESGDSSG